MSGIEIGSVWVCMGFDIEVTSIAMRDDRQIIVSYQYLKSKERSQAFISDFLKRMTPKDDSQNIAASILQDAIDAMSERGKSYDTDGKGVERSMDKVVAMFNTLTGHTLTTEQGWDFMILLKLVRASQGYKHDNYIDGSAYFGLAGEAASEAVDD